ncbi:Predicted O-methyltransferase YrrM [Lachnospiraceae bacterium KH1T2]|nr:Predicted O-methyltransferase YrrM [Lachnospiraceae bacterium KH1T2]
MIVNERCTAFINSLNTGNTPFLNEIEKNARQTWVPIIRKETQTLLKFLLAEHRPETILEIGAAVGFSAILMAQYSEAQITTIENYDVRIPIAKENFEKSGFKDRITLLEGNAEEILPTLNGSYDMIFIDAAKAQYPYYLEEAKRLLKKGGLLVADNCLQDGDVFESKFAVNRRNRTIHKRMRDFLYSVTHDAEFSASVLPVGDGVTLAVRI